MAVPRNRSRTSRARVATVVALLLLVTSTTAVANAVGPVSVPAPASSPAFAPAWATATRDLDAPDPHVLRVGSTYYAYTTGTTWGNHLGILRSTSPQSGWQTITGGRFGSSAFPSVPPQNPVASWQVPATTHAPGVFALGGQYVMYYGAQTNAGHGGHYCLSVATSSSPAGPFVDRSGGAPWLCMDAQGGVIDPSPFLDANGQPWLAFKTYDDINQTTQPSAIYVVPLGADGLTTTAAPTLVLAQNNMSSPFETVENPQMVRVDGTYTLVYSRGEWGSASYRQGYAVCAAVTGPCTEGAPTAFLSSYGDVRGPGGGSVFQDTDANWWIAYHGWNGSPGCVGYSSTCARKMYTAPIQFSATPLQVPCDAALPIAGYRMVASDGGVFSFGNQQFCGSTGNIRLNQPIVTMATPADGGGYWLVASDGGIFSFGNAAFHGSTGNIRLNQPIVGMAPTPSGNGYWLAARDGGIFAFGDAAFRGSTGNIRLNQPIVGMARTPSGNGYWLVARDGGIFAFGDAVFHGSTGNIRLNQPIVGIAATPSGNGYWLVASDGGIFAFGDAVFHGSTGATRLNQPIVGIAAAPSGNGYRLVASDGGIFAFGEAPFHGSTGNTRLNQPIVALR
jgi:hypothetical protein